MWQDANLVLDYDLQIKVIFPFIRIFLHGTMILWNLSCVNIFAVNVSYLCMLSTYVCVLFVLTLIEFPMYVRNVQINNPLYRFIHVSNSSWILPDNLSPVVIEIVPNSGEVIYSINSIHITSSNLLLKIMYLSHRVLGVYTVHVHIHVKKYVKINILLKKEFERNPMRCQTTWNLELLELNVLAPSVNMVYDVMLIIMITFNTLISSCMFEQNKFY